MPSHHGLSVPVTAITRTVTVAAGRFAAGNSGRSDSVSSLRVGGCRSGGDSRGPASAAGLAVAGRGVFPGGDVPVPGGWVPAGMGQVDLRDRRRPAGPQREGSARSAPPSGLRSDEGLFEVVAGALAQPRTPSVRFGPYRTVSFDGCSSIKTPDSERNRGWLGAVPTRRLSPDRVDDAGRDRDARGDRCGVRSHPRGRNCLRHPAVASSGP